MEVNKDFHIKIQPYIESIQEEKFCTVIALALVTSKPLDKCFEYMKKCGRQHRRGMTTSEVIDALRRSREFNFEWTEFESPLTLNQFTQKFAKGEYHVLVSGHALAVINGVVYDHTIKPRRRVLGYFKVSLREN